MDSHASAARSGKTIRNASSIFRAPQKELGGQDGMYWIRSRVASDAGIAGAVITSFWQYQKGAPRKKRSGATELPTVGSAQVAQIAWHTPAFLNSISQRAIRYASTSRLKSIE